LRRLSGDGVKASEAMWNIAAAITGWESVNSDYFQWRASKASIADSKEPNWGIVKGASLDIALIIVNWEKEHSPIPNTTVKNVPAIAA
jgi:hypothetical protein